MNAGKLKLGILISGRGSNLQALIEACADPDYSAEIAVVVSNRPMAQGLDRAREAGLPVVALDHKVYDGREGFEAALQEVLDAHGADFVCNAGFMRILTDGFVRTWEGRMLNIHPSLLPAFKGVKVHEQAIAAGVRLSGCTVHFVSADVDSGPIVGQAAVPVLPDDTPDSLAARILVQEHRLYPLCVRLVAEGRARLDGGRVVFSGVTADEAAALMAPET